MAALQGVGAGWSLPPGLIALEGWSSLSACSWIGGWMCRCAGSCNDLERPRSVLMRSSHEQL